MNTPVCDYLIVGGGTAGCVLANRLSADPSCRVILLEAGGPDDDKWIHIPAGIRYLLREKKHNWFYMTEPSPLTNGRSVYWPRGKVLGGSSSINGMVYIRGQRTDFDRWAASGATGWDWDSLFPYFLKIENQTRGADAYHAVDGPLTVSDRTNRSEVWTRFIAAAEQLGIPRNPDFNGADQEGVGYYQATVGNGRRCSAAVGYLRPVKGRANLSVITGAMVHHISFEQRRATGVRYEKDGHWHELRAAREVLVCGGSINSPQLLMLSGIGPSDELQRHGIGVLHHLPGVGQHLHDHPDVVQVVNAPGLTELFGLSLRGGLNVLRGMREWRTQRRRMLTTNFAEAGGFIRSRPEEDAPDLQLHFVIGKLVDHGRKTVLGHGYSLHVCLLQPQSRGSVRLASGDPLQAPLIDPGFLAHDGDMARMVRGFQMGRHILRQPALAQYGGREVPALARAQTEEQIAQFIRRHADTIYHPVGSCRMGPGPLDVVDGELRVHGLQGLRVVDASIMPRIVSGNTNAPTVMIAEKAADMIRQAA